jgi:hypothetical protein
MQCSSCPQFEPSAVDPGMPPNKSLQRSGTHKVLGRGRPSAETAHGHWRARVLKGRRAVAELGR